MKKVFVVDRVAINYFIFLNYFLQTQFFTKKQFFTGGIAAAAWHRKAIQPPINQSTFLLK